MRVARPGGRRLSREGGFALLIVLWALVLLSLVFIHLVANGRSQANLAGNLRIGASAQAVADGALYQAVLHVLDASGQRWTADGVPHEVSVAGGRARVSLVDLGGRINPNRAPVALLAALLHELGIDAVRAGAVAQAIVDWRNPDAQGKFKAPQYRAAGLSYAPPGSAFQSIDELGLVLGMTPQMLQLLRPHLSLFNPNDPNPDLADPVVRRALRDAGTVGTASGGRDRPLRAVRVTAAVVMRDGGRFIRRADIGLAGSAGSAPFEVLSWQAPPWPQTSSGR